VIEKILTSAGPIGLEARGLYVHCLIYHFSKLEAKTANITAFEIYNTDIKNFERHRKTFIQLDKAGLVSVNLNTVAFHNMWGAHIDRTKLEKSKPEEFIGAFEMKPPSFYANDLYKSKGVIETCIMKHGLKEQEVKKMMEAFVGEKESSETAYQSLRAFITDFYYYARTNNRSFSGAQRSKTKTTLTAVQSAAVKLGISN
jgi:hypothetical protein